MGEHVHREQVVIPYQTPAEVLADAMQRRLYEGFLQQETVHQMHTDIDAGDFEGRTPEALLGFKSHRAIARLLIFFSHLLPDMGVLPEVVLIAPVTTEGQTGFDDGTTAVARRMVIVARVAPTHRSKGAQRLVELIIGIEARLQGIEALGLVAATFLEGLDMCKTNVAADAELGRQLEVLADAIVNGTGEAVAQTHKMRTDTYDIIGTLVAIAHGKIKLALIATEHHPVDGGLRTDVHQTDARGTGNRVFGIIDDT